jgi:lipid-A-disaccharide synthase
MGLVEVLHVLPRLLKLRATLIERFLADRPDVVIGIDAPDFNLGLERRLRERGLKTVHVVSPTVWAWRQGRIHGIAKSVDRMLCLFPFEPQFYAAHGVAADYIGHPLADELDDGVTPAQARQSLGLPVDGALVALLPGSRGGELKYLAEPFAQTAALLARHLPGVRFITPIAKPKLRPALEAAIAAHAPGLSWTLLDGQSREAMRAADVVLLASGTATLECLLLGRPMVAAYRTSALTAWMMLGLGLLKTRYVSLPNLLAAEATVPEMLQDDCAALPLAREVAMLLEHRLLRERQQAQFAAVRATLKRNAAERAAAAIASLIESGKRN